MTRASFDAQRGPEGALVVGSPDDVVKKIRHYDEVLGGISRLSLQMNVTSLPHAKLMRAIELLAPRWRPRYDRRWPPDVKMPARLEGRAGICVAA